MGDCMFQSECFSQFVFAGYQGGSGNEKQSIYFAVVLSSGDPGNRRIPSLCRGGEQVGGETASGDPKGRTGREGRIPKSTLLSPSIPTTRGMPRFGKRTHSLLVYFGAKKLNLRCALLTSRGASTDLELFHFACYCGGTDVTKQSERRVASAQSDYQRPHYDGFDSRSLFALTPFPEPSIGSFLAKSGLILSEKLLWNHAGGHSPPQLSACAACTVSKGAGFLAAFFASKCMGGQGVQPHGSESCVSTAGIHTAV